MSLVVLSFAFLLGNALCTDEHYPRVIQKLAFGSCHKIGDVGKYDDNIVWDAIRKTDPDTFLWTGDSIYPPVKGTASVTELRSSYHQMQNDASLGYSAFSPPLGIHGTWDDHDYGGNDRGIEMPLKPERQREFLQFLKVPRNSPRYDRPGVYNGVHFGDEGSDEQVRVIFLDTRSDRDRHCIPSVAAIKYLPLSAVIACFTRWLSSGFHLAFCRSNKIIGEEQWTWLEQELKNSTAQAHIVISSVQIFTTNPLVESWGHYPKEKKRLLSLLNQTRGLVLLSGDVHFAEISTLFPPPKSAQPLVEVTSSGLTHSCETAFYGPICRPVLNAYSRHRYAHKYNYYSGRNFGTIEFYWNKRTMIINVHNITGGIILSTGDIKIGEKFILSQDDFEYIFCFMNNRFVPWIKFGFIFLFILVVGITKFTRPKQSELKVKTK